MINWGIIGCGDVTERKSGPAFNKVNGSKLLAVARRDAEKAADYARRHGVERWSGDAYALLEMKDIDAIYVATPPSSHLEYVCAALEKGFSVYVEKPVALNTAEALKMAEAAQASAGKLVVAHYRRRLPLFLKVKELLEQKVIGEIRTVQMRLWQSIKPALVTTGAANWRTNPAISGGGYFHDLAPHQLDLMLYFFGEPVHYDGFSQCQAGDDGVADQTSGTILFADKIVFNGSWCFNVADTDTIDECEIIGSAGSIRFAVFGQRIVVKDGNGEQVFEFEHPEHVQQPMIASVVGFFNGQEENPCTIEEAVELMKIMDKFARLTV
ncbi:Gfo/Idh/MocA family protein [Filimonas effusa]|uniref:Gfo/Idh/MocA family oxidoreductase n=1 Tax=Filimonas effusa TaxID=2508721 RepID=A0A4Q1DAW7_9BACT|nr:Gfo/Idh/MocA family oxidoreductase [Filimonas effusa]RXK86562.1 Gfo/Idh/MocA family oxidoreductase [Filimonas effusa]